MYFNKEDVAKRWKECFEDLYKVNEIITDGYFIGQRERNSEDEVGPLTMKKDSEALLEIRSSKVTGPDGIPAELCGENGSWSLHRIKDYCFVWFPNYEIGNLTKKFIESKTILIHKKANAIQCSNLDKNNTSFTCCKDAQVWSNRQ